MRQDILISAQSENMAESQIIKKISKKWRRGILKSYLKGALITILIIAVIALILFMFIGVELHY